MGRTITPSRCISWNPMRLFDPHWTDIISDDAVFLHLQYSTQWDSLAHVGQLFDVDGDGE